MTLLILFHRRILISSWQTTCVESKRKLLPSPRQKGTVLIRSMPLLSQCFIRYFSSTYAVSSMMAAVTNNVEATLKASFRFSGVSNKYATNRPAGSGCTATNPSQSQIFTDLEFPASFRCFFISSKASNVLTVIAYSSMTSLHLFLYVTAGPKEAPGIYLPVFLIFPEILLSLLHRDAEAFFYRRGRLSGACCVSS